MLPGIQLSTIGLLPQQRVALLVRPRVTAPHGKESVIAQVTFHVEQAPIKEAASLLATAIDECMAARFERHDGHGLAELAKMGDRGAIQARLPIAAGMPQPGPMRGIGAVPPFGEHVQRWLALADEAIAHATTEAARMGEQVDRFEQAGLAAPVGPGHEVEPGPGMEIH